MKTRNQIIEALFLGKNFNDCIDKMDPPHLRQDLRMEVMAIVCEWPDHKTVKLHEDGKLEFYVVRVIINMLSNKYSPFHKRYRIPTEKLAETEIAVEEDDAEREDRESQEDAVMGAIDELYWYNAEMVKLYLKHGNYRAIQAETGIPYVSCYKNIQKSFAELKQKVAI